MIAAWIQDNLGPKQEKWPQMMVVSFAFHLAIFFGSLVVTTNKMYYPSMEEPVYHVELVAAPPATIGGGVKGAPVNTGKSTAPAVKTIKKTSRRIQGKPKSSPTVIAKRVSPKPPLRSKKKASASELIDSAISKVEQEVAERGTQVEDAISTIEKRLERKKQSQSREAEEKSESPATPNPKRTEGTPVGYSGVGKGIQLYQLRIETTIKENWSYPVALIHAREKKPPEAVVLLTLRSDGKILHSEFKKKSWDPLFNDSVLKALERSDPLPKFPPGYRKSSDEVEIRFSLKDLIQ